MDQLATLQKVEIPRYAYDDGAMTAAYRPIVFSWLFELSAELDLSPRILSLVYTLFDTFTSASPSEMTYDSTESKKWKIQSYACACLLLATKFTGRDDVFRLKDLTRGPLALLAYYSAYCFKPRQCAECELRVLQAIDYNLHCMLTACDFIDVLSSVHGVPSISVALLHLTHAAIYRTGNQQYNTCSPQTQATLVLTHFYPSLRGRLLRLLYDYDISDSQQKLFDKIIMRDIVEGEILWALCTLTENTRRTLLNT